MERKIGEIFEHNGEWYQCVKGLGCNECIFPSIECYLKTEIGYCSPNVRKDETQVVFKRLEKVGEPVIINGTLVQKMKTPVAIECKQCVLNNNGCSIIYEKCFNKELYVSEQNKENMKKNELKLKPFDLEAARSGKPVCTRDGRKVRIICFDKKDSIYPIIALVESQIDNREDLLQYTSTGKFLEEKECDGRDLMMLPEKHEGWVNVYRDFNVVHAKNVYETMEEALKNIDGGENRIATVKIEWYE